MCGRYGLDVSGEVLAELLGLDGLPPALAAGVRRHNVAPTQPHPVGRVGRDGARELATPRWGLVPSWAKDRKGAARLINARSETVATKPSFRSAFRRRRCVVPADVWYEWRRDGRAKQPFAFARAGEGPGPDRPFLMAGLWESWKPKDDPDAGWLETFTVLTRAATASVQPIHHRMPVLLEPEMASRWLDPGTDPTALTRWLEGLADGAAEAAQLRIWPVGDGVGSYRNDTPDVRAPIALSEA